MKRAAFFIFLLQSVWQFANAQLITYKAPQGSLLNSDFTVKVRQPGGKWQPVPTYLARVANVIDTKSIIENTSVAYFDFSGEIEVSVIYNKAIIKNARIRPSSYKIPFKSSQSTITFSLNKARNLSIEVNGDIFHNLQLFANPIETYKLSPSDSSIIYFGPGIHQVGTLEVPSNKTVYIAGGAVVQGQILIEKAENVRILGHGILTQLPLGLDVIKTAANVSLNKTKSSRNDELTINSSKNVEISGPIVLPHKYSVLIGQSRGVTITNIKSLSSEGNADGIDVFCSSDISIDGVFMRNSDDCIAVYGHRWSYYGNTTNITVKNSTLWADIAHPILIGTHGDAQNPDTLGNMKFKNIDILDQHENQIDYQGCIALNAGDNNLLRNISFENFQIENIRKGQLFNIRVMYNHKYNEAPGKGIENIYFKNITYQGWQPNTSIISGYDETRKIKNVVFENLRINDQIIADDMAGKPRYYKTGDMANILIGEHADSITFIRNNSDSSVNH